MTEILISIRNCKECPNFAITATTSTDGWDSGEDWHCKKADKPIQGFVEWFEEKKVPIPEWCPSLVKNQK